MILTAAHDEAGGADPLAPTTSAQPDGPGWRLNGCKIAVPYGPQAERIVTSASLTTGGTALFLVDPWSGGRNGGGGVHHGGTSRVAHP